MPEPRARRELGAEPDDVGVAPVGLLLRLAGHRGAWPTGQVGAAQISHAWRLRHAAPAGSGVQRGFCASRRSYRALGERINEQRRGARQAC